jgi:hypothetical protein
MCPWVCDGCESGTFLNDTWILGEVIVKRPREKKMFGNSKPVGSMEQNYIF